MGGAPALDAKHVAEASRLIAEGQHKAAVALHFGVDRSMLYRTPARTEQPG